MSTATPQITLSGFADEAAFGKTAEQQFAAFAALGLQFYSLRYIDTGEGVKNVLKLSKTEMQAIRHLEDEYGLNVASIGSPLGKVKLVDQEDGTDRPYVPFKKYLEKEVKHACDVAHAFETKLIRGFTFYPPAGSDPREHLSQVVEQLGEIAETCLRSDLTFGIEVEAELVGHNGQLMAEIHRQVNNPALVLVFDAGNLALQGYGPAEILEQFRLMKPGLGWLHVKDYKRVNGAKALAEKGTVPFSSGKSGQSPVPLEAYQHFVPVGMGDCGYEPIFRELAELLPKLDPKLRRRGIPGVFVELESQMLSAGARSGKSGPDGMGVALRSLCRVLDYVELGYHLRDFDDVRAARVP